MDDQAVSHFAVMRLEHRHPDGTVRVLLSTTMWSAARASASTWRTQLRRQGGGGELVIVAEDTGEVLATYPIPMSEPNLGGLTARQTEALALLCAGLTVAEIAERLGVGTSAVYQFRWAIRHHLGVASIAEACRSLASPGTDPKSAR